MAIKIGNRGQDQNAPASSAAPARPVPNITTQNAAQTSNSGFTRYVGYTDAVSFEKKLVELYIKTKTDGLFIDKPVPKASSPEVMKINSTAEIPQNIDQATVLSVLNKLLAAKLLDLKKIGCGKTPSEAAQVIYSIFDDIKASSSSPNAVKNIFVSILCWLIRYNTYKLTNLLFIGEADKANIYWLYVLSRLGCTVSYVNYRSDDSYLAVDKQSKYSNPVIGTVFEPLNINLGKINVAAYNEAAKVNDILSQPSPVMLKYLTVLDDSFEKEIQTPLNLRQAKLVCTDTTIPLYFTAYIGFDDEVVYSNMLFSMKEEMARNNKQLIFLQELKKPTYEEAGEYYQIQKTNDQTMINLFASRITVNDRIGRTLLAQKAFIEAMNRSNSNNPYNTAVQLANWLKKFTSSIDFFNKDIPVIMYYGSVTETELIFLNMMSQTGFDVIYFSPDKSVIPLLNRAGIANMQIVERTNSKPGMPFPDKLIRTKLATTAYNAEQSLDTILYSDNTMFRNYQFRHSRNQTLKTTYEELGLMWHQESKYRTGFDSKENYVIVPNLFAKISGVKNGDIQAYYKEIQLKLSPLSVYYKQVPFFKPAMTNDYYTTLYSGTTIKIEELKKSKYNKYDYMNDDIQYLIFNKMQEVVDSGFLSNIPPSDLLPLVIKTGLNIPSNLLQILQSFDFTKDIPKIVIVSNGKQTFAVFECILLLLFNMIGFDIIVFTPTGYKNLESFLNPDAFQTFTLGEFQYDFRAQSLRPPKEIPKEKTSFFNRIFKGKNK